MNSLSDNKRNKIKTPIFSHKEHLAKREGVFVMYHVPWAQI